MPVQPQKIARTGEKKTLEEEKIFKTYPGSSTIRVRGTFLGQRDKRKKDRWILNGVNPLTSSLRRWDRGSGFVDPPAVSARRTETPGLSELWRSRK